MRTQYATLLLIACVVGNTACYGAPDDVDDSREAVMSTGSGPRPTGTTSASGARPRPTAAARDSGATAVPSISSGEEHRMVVSSVGGCPWNTGKTETVTLGGCTYTLENFNCEYDVIGGDRVCVCTRRVTSTSGDCTQVSILPD